MEMKRTKEEGVPKCKKGRGEEVLILILILIVLFRTEKQK